MPTENANLMDTSFLYGFDEKRSHIPRWLRVPTQAKESSIYPGAIPQDDVIRRLFSWEAVSQPVFIKEGEEFVEIPARQAISHSETGHVFVIANTKYVIHQYTQWLLHQVNNIFAIDELQIGAAGLVRQGGGAFVSIERPDNVVSRNGIALRPHFLAATSHDHKIATTYKFVATIDGCGNWIDPALIKASPVLKARHTKNSVEKLEEARDHLNLLIIGGNDMIDFVDALADIPITDSQWEQIVEQLVEISVRSEPKVKARLENKKEVFNQLWTSDERCAPWRGSAFGVFQVFNTHRQHIAGKDDLRLDRNLRNLFTATGLKEDRKILRVIEDVTKRSIIGSRGQ
jgi:phage/plasmid-like protein (TIGR03299 family)